MIVNLFAEFVIVLAEVRRVVRQLEADLELKLSRTPRLSRELSETLSIMVGEMTQNSVSDIIARIIC